VHQVPVLAYGGGGAIAETLGEGGLILTRKEPAEVAAAAALLLEEPGIRRRVVEAQTANLARFEPAQLRERLGRFIEGLGFCLPKPTAYRGTVASKMAYRIEGPFTSSYSLALVNRQLGLALARTGKSVELRSMEGAAGDFHPDSAFLSANPEVATLVGRADEPGIIAAPAEICLRNMFPPRPDDIRAAELRGLACYAWEESGFPRAYADAMNRSLDLVTVTSGHVKRILQDSGVHVPTAVVGNGADHFERIGRMPDRKAAEAMLGNAPGFRFLHISSAFPRKGIDVLLTAWERLSQQGEWQASLVIKTFPNPHNRVSELVEQFRKNCPSLAPVVVIQDDLDEGEIRGLYEACHAVVAPSRAEGYGLPLAEAMLARKPVITTGWGGQTDFCTEETAWLVGWSFAYAKTHLGVFDSVWAEPSTDDLVRQMRSVRSASPDALVPRLRAAENLIRSRHSWDHVAARVQSAVSEVRHAPSAVALRLPKVALVSTWASRCGIATYAEAQAAAIPASQLTVLANEDASPLRPDTPDIRRVWRTGLQDDLSRLAAAITDCDPDIVVFQFNFGFFRLDALGPLIESLVIAGKSVHVVLHSTADVRRPDLNISLQEAAPSLAQATRLIVHGLDDLNRLKDFGLSRNALLFPHGIPTVPGGHNGDNASLQAAARARKVFGLDNRPVIGTFGYLLPNKGLRELIQAHQILCKAAQEERAQAPHLLLVNALYPDAVSEQECEACRSLIRELDLDGAVTLITDYLPEAEALSLLRIADAVVYSYQQTQESVSGAVRLGLASGRPVAVTPLPIFGDVSEVTHMLPGRSPPELAQGLKNLLREAGKWGRLSCPSSEAACSLSETGARQAEWIATYSWPNVARRFWSVLRATAPDQVLK
jgi:glycosyltransferase involved in cell wall biosynthesis